MKFKKLIDEAISVGFNQTTSSVSEIVQSTAKRQKVESAATGAPNTALPPVPEQISNDNLPTFGQEQTANILLSISCTKETESAQKLPAPIGKIVGGWWRGKWDNIGKDQPAGDADVLFLGSTICRLGAVPQANRCTDGCRFRSPRIPT